ncbi:unnamed protein product [Eruca vesicaria subsp. sativa]|uniref:At2g35280-like TPR domain-containing protein n=1 Tax=Eruca vesicaria subsp. sativa TaxID=29727 RepID=A0ABC8KEB9_ERUVS|nr:unnamed protein product [Eruca vesicaria subsp. sativa]
MSNFNLASLPPSMIHKILSKVETSHIRDFGSERVDFSGFNQIGRGEYFYRFADLFNLNGWIDEANAVRTFRLRCYQSVNLEAIYMRGMYEFFVLHLLDEGREKFHLASERGFLLAKYVDGMMNLAISVDDRGLVHNYPSFSRDFFDRMNYMITTSVFLGHWNYEKPEVFMCILERIDLNVLHNCWCSAVIEPVFVVSLDGSRTRWRCNHCFWQCAA